MHIPQTSAIVNNTEDLRKQECNHTTMLVPLLPTVPSPAATFHFSMSTTATRNNDYCFQLFKKNFFHTTAKCHLNEFNELAALKGTVDSVLSPRDDVSMETKKPKLCETSELQEPILDTTLGEQYSENEELSASITDSDYEETCRKVTRKSRRKPSISTRNKRTSNTSSRGTKRKKRYNIGAWTKEEHERFLLGYKECGRNWSYIAKKFVKTRGRTQIASHAQKWFKKMQKNTIS